MGTPLSPYSPSAVRSNLIPSPPTYNTAHDYISWESFSNVSYYTRILPSVPQDCPTPMGTKGNGDGVGGGSQELLCSLWGNADEKAIIDPFPRQLVQDKTYDISEPWTRTGLENENRKWWRLACGHLGSQWPSQTSAFIFPGCLFA